LAILLSSVFGIIYVQGDDGLLSTVTISQGGSTVAISSGVYPGAPSYTIFTENGLFYAKDAYNAVPEWGIGSANASYVWQNAFDSLNSTGGTIFAKKGIYLLNNDLQLSSYQAVIVQGEGRFASETQNLVLNSGGTILLFNGTHMDSTRTEWVYPSFWTWKNLGFVFQGVYDRPIWTMNYMLFNLYGVGFHFDACSLPNSTSEIPDLGAIQDGSVVPNIAIIFPSGGPPGISPIWQDILIHDHRQSGNYSWLFCKMPRTHYIKICVW
jgi:hypothetical protein